MVELMKKPGFSIALVLEALQDQYALDWYGLHGVAHWARVYENGLRMADSYDVNLDLLLLFSIFHDSCRVNDSVDPGHGRRGAELASELRGSYFELTDDEFDLLYHACESHTDGLTEGDLSVQVCWDADRLDLARVRTLCAESEKLCTEAAKDPEMIAWASDRARSAYVPELLSTEWNQRD